MYISITTIGLETSRTPELVAFYERFMPALRDVKGWRHLYLLVNHERGEAKVLAIWETEADAYAFESSGKFRGIISQLRDVASGPADREVLEVVFQALPPDTNTSRSP